MKAALNNRVVNLPRGKMLGGTSGINLLMAAFPTKNDLDNWAKLGNAGWGFDDLSPYFRKFEGFSPPLEETMAKLQTEYLDESLHGQTGPIHTSIPKSYWPLAEVWTSTIENLGIGPHEDSKTGVAIGGHTTLALVDPSTSTRSYSATAYLQPNAARPNLFVKTNTVVTKINFTKGDPNYVATGVNVIYNDKQMTINATNEVILCAGAFGSPQILELSGIGNSSILKSYGIDILVDNSNVGENSQDHPLACYSAEVSDDIKTLESLKEPKVLEQALREYSENQTGPLAASVVSSSAFVPLKHACSTGGTKVSVEDEFTAIKSLLLSDDTLHSKQHEISRDAILNSDEPSSQYLLAHVGLPVSSSSRTARPQEELTGNYITVIPCLMHSFSRGSVHICSQSPSVLPKVDPRWLSHAADLKILCKHMLHAVQIFSTEPLCSQLKHNGKLLQPGYYSLTEDNVEDFVRNNAETEHHPVGTCSMLPRADGGVVDTELIVYGTSNLRIVDASIIPLHISANPTCTIYAIAEKAADMVKEKWRFAA